MSAHIHHSEGGTDFSCWWEPGKPSAIVRIEGIPATPHLTLDIPDDGARRDGAVLVLDLDLADAVARAMRRAITEYRKRGGHRD